MLPPHFYTHFSARVSSGFHGRSTKEQEEEDEEEEEERGGRGGEGWGRSRQNLREEFEVF